MIKFNAEYDELKSTFLETKAAAELSQVSARNKDLGFASFLETRVSDPYAAPFNLIDCQAKLLAQAVYDDVRVKRLGFYRTLELEDVYWQSPQSLQTNKLANSVFLDINIRLTFIPKRPSIYPNGKPRSLHSILSDLKGFCPELPYNRSGFVKSKFNYMQVFPNVYMLTDGNRVCVEVEYKNSFLFFGKFPVSQGKQKLNNGIKKYAQKLFK